MKYQEFKKKQQDEFDKLPMKAAFVDKHTLPYVVDVTLEKRDSYVSK